MGKNIYAEVLIEYEVKSLDKVFTYKIPSFLLDKIKVGMKVKVPFNNKLINGLVLKLKDSYDEQFEIKEITEILNEDIIFDDEMFKIAEKLKNLTLCSLSTAFKTMVPASLKVSSNKKSMAKYEKLLILNKEENVIEEYINNNKKAKKQIELLEKLKSNEQIFYRDYPVSVVKVLAEKELITYEYIPKYRIMPKEKIKSVVALTEEQSLVINNILKDKDKYKTHLIYGVTASGKTEVYFNLIETILKNNQTALVLVPEITLSTQLIKRFYERFGNIVGIYHSSLSDAERYDEYLKAYRNEVKIMIGTRSSVFIPLKNLGIIIIDEEHSDNFKQDTTPRYNAIEIAKFRAKYHNIPLVLGSATPSLESMAKANAGIYSLHTMKKRIGKSLLPEVTIVDMAEEMKKRNTVISELLKDNINKCLNANEQVIILLNRRGYSSFITCHNCGYTYKCKYCDISLTYHKSSDSLRCHYCGYTVIKDDKCPECHESALSFLGTGTENLEDILKKEFPNAKTLRMDTDTTANKGSHEKIINAFKNHEYDILIGTQMISKGLDFPLVTLVGVINADASLNIPDFRSSERTFELLDQVAGRAGRSGLKGNVIIQTFNPDNYIFENVKNHDYESFYQNEMTIRKKLKYPPYYFLTSIKIISPEYELASKEATKVKSFLEKKLQKSTIILGPTTANVFRINNTYRFQIIIKYQKDDQLEKALKDLEQIFITNKKVYLEIDNNPLKV